MVHLLHFFNSSLHLASFLSSAEERSLKCDVTIPSSVHEDDTKAKVSCLLLCTPGDYASDCLQRFVPNQYFEDDACNHSTTEHPSSWTEWSRRDTKVPSKAQSPSFNSLRPLQWAMYAWDCAAIMSIGVEGSTNMDILRWEAEISLNTRCRMSTLPR